MRKRTWFAFGFFGCVLVSAIAGGWRLHALNAQRVVRQFQDHQQHTADVIASVLRSEFTGVSRTLRAVADAARGSGDDQLPRLIATQMRCADAPCFAAMAVFDRDGSVRHAAGRALGLGAADVQVSLEWAQEPADAARMRVVLSAARPPALVFITPIAASRHPGAGAAPAMGILAAELEFDVLFAGHQRAIEPDWPRYATLVLDGRGNLMFHSRHPEMRLNNVFRRTRRCYACHESFDHVERMIAIERGVLQYPLHGVPQLAAVAPLRFENEAWVAAIVSPSETAVGALAAELRQLAMIMFAMVLALGAAAKVTWTDARRRLDAAAEASRKASLERSHAALTALNAKLESAAVEWRMTVDTIDAALVVLDPSGRIQRMNRVASDMLPGWPFSWIGRPSDALKEHPPWDSALAIARDAFDRDAVSTARVRHSASGRTWDLWCRPSEPRDGRQSVVIVARDVTSVVELQESLRRSETMAALGSVVVGVAHEVRNPLFAISSMVDALAVQRRKDPTRFIEALRGAVTRLQTLMTELLEYGTPSAPMLQPQRIGPVLEEAVRSCLPEAEARTVRVTACTRSEAEVSMDPRRLVRVFINLIQNAIQHAASGSEVTIELREREREASRVEVTVRDRGPGFHADDLPRIFTPFFSRRAGGFGLGLAISERIVAEHRGKVSAWNHADGGAVVSVSLPLAPADRSYVFEGAQPC